MSAPLSPLRVIVADDELQARKRLVRLLQEAGQVEIVAVCANAAEVLAALARSPVDVLVLDISMPGQSGLDLRAALGERAPPIIFVTAHPEHAVRAFELGVVDYVVKPVSAERLAKALERVRTVASSPTRLPLDTRRGVVFFDPNTLEAARWDGTLVTLLTPEGEVPISSSLKELEERLPRERFVRTDRRHLVNLDHALRFSPNDQGGATLTLRSGFEVPVSRQVARMLRRRWGA